MATVDKHCVCVCVCVCVYVRVFRCHVCGFETEGRGLFHGHMTEHRQWEHRSFSLHCCVCDHSANQEADMQAHTDTHAPGETHTPGEAHTPGDTPALSGEMR